MKIVDKFFLGVEKGTINFESLYVDCIWIQENDLSFDLPRKFKEREGYLGIISRNSNEIVWQFLKS